jgi:hypothetical protein
MSLNVSFVTTVQHFQHNPLPPHYFPLHKDLDTVLNAINSTKMPLQTLRYKEIKTFSSGRSP